MFRTSFMYVNRTRKFVVKIWSEWDVARLVLPVSAIVVLFWTAGLWTVHSKRVPYSLIERDWKRLRLTDSSLRSRGLDIVARKVFVSIVEPGSDVQQ